jgi:hypothetical protein
MCIVRLAATTFTTLFLSTVGAHADGTWCAQYGSPDATNCGFYSFEQCQAALSGNGGFCYSNPWAGNSVQRRSRR